MIADRLSVSVDHPDGTSTRWGPDEVDAGLVPGDLVFTTSMPGGFQSANCRLARSLRREGREGLFDRMRIVGPGRRVAWEGRLDQMPRSSDDGGSVTPQAVGHSALLDDRKAFAGIILDRSMERWSSVNLGRRAALGASFRVEDGTTEWHPSAGPCVSPTFPPRAWSSSAGRPYGAVMYDAGPGLSVKRLTARFHRFGSQTYLGDSNWICQIYGGNTPDALAGFEGRTDLRTVGDGGDASYTASTPHRYWEAAAYYQAAPAGTAEGPEYGFRLYNVGAHGAHGLTERTGAGTHPDGSSMTGYTASDVLAYALPKAAPGVSFTTGAGGSITPSDFPIGHLVFDQMSSGSDVVHAVNVYHQWEWGVWEDGVFYFHPTGARAKTWHARVGERFRLAPEGDKSTNIYTGVVVEYQDANGRRSTIGPPGTSVETADALLADTNPNNPAIANGVSRIGQLTLSAPATALGALTIGRAWLLEQSRASRAGSATALQVIVDENGQEHPAWAVRAGDRLVVDDRPQDPPRTIIETQYDHASRAVSMTLDNTAPRLDALLQRVGASVVGIL